LRDIVLRQVAVIDQPTVGVGDFDRVELVPLNIFNQRKLKELPSSWSSMMYAGILARRVLAARSLRSPGDQLVLPRSLSAP